MYIYIPCAIVSVARRMEALGAEFIKSVVQHDVYW